VNGSPGTLKTGGLLDTSKLNRLGSTGGLLICDIEGGEMDLFDPAAGAALQKMDVLVEVHQTGDKDVTTNATTLRQRLEPTHVISTLDDTQRVKDYTGISALDEAHWDKAMAEGRPYAQVWLWMKCR
jgi:hypothetical protein